PGHLGEQLLALPQARADEQDQTRIVNRRVKRDSSRRRRLARLPATIEQDPRRARAKQARLPRIGFKSEAILDERDRIKRMSEIESKVKRHARPQRESLRSLSPPPRPSPWLPATRPGERPQRFRPVPRDIARAPGSAPRATAGNRAIA